MTLKDLINQLQDLPEEYLDEELFTVGIRGGPIIRVNKTSIRKVKPLKTVADGVSNPVHPPRLVITLD